MRFNFKTAVYSGELFQFPNIARALIESYPNFIYLIERIKDIESGTLERESRWRYHILQQLTFAYLDQEYLQRSVEPVLDSIADSKFLPSGIRLRKHVSQLASGNIAMLPKNMLALNEAALDFLDELAHYRTEIIHETMNDVGRRLLAKSGRSNERHLRNSFSLLLLVLHGHINERILAEKLRMALSFALDSSTPLGMQALDRLMGLRNDLCSESKFECLFFADDLRQHVPELAVGDASFIKADNTDAFTNANLPEAVQTRVEEFAKRTPYYSLIKLTATSHPDDAITAIENAQSLLEPVLGFLASQSDVRYCPPRRYESAAFSPFTVGSVFVAASGKARNSVFPLYESVACDFKRYFDEFAEPVLAETQEKVSRERYRRMLCNIRQANFAYGSEQYSQALLSAWQAYETTFCGPNDKARGKTVARRVAAISISTDGFASFDQLEVTDEDFIAFAHEAAAASSPFNIKHDMKKILDKARTLAPGDPHLSVLKHLLGTDEVDQLFDWYTERFRRRVEIQSKELVDEVERRRQEVATWIDEFYQLRNDIIHSGYDEAGIARLLYEEASRLHQSFALNLAFNYRKKGSHSALLESLDAELRPTNE